MAKKPGVYIIRSPSGKCYIGSSRNMHRRWLVHMCELRKGEHPCFPLQKAYNKYDGNLTFHVAEFCEESVRFEREQWWLDNWKTLTPGIYNLSMTAAHASRSESGRLRIIESNRSRVYTDEMRANISAAQKLRFEIHGVSDETKAKLRAPRGPYPPERREKYRYPKTQSHRDKLSVAQKASWSDERRAMQSRLVSERKIQQALERVNWIAWG